MSVSNVNGVCGLSFGDVTDSVLELWTAEVLDVSGNVVIVKCLGWD